MILSHVVWNTHPDRGDEIFPAIRIPMVCDTRVHSFQIQVRFRDQGWGNRKGKFYIVLQKRTWNCTPGVSEEDSSPTSNAEGTASNSQRSMDDFQGGRVVFESQVADHTVGAVALRLGPPPPSCDYYLWARIGGGGGHQLFFQSVELSFTLFDQSGYFERNYRLLNQCGALDPQILMRESNTRDKFHLKMLHRVTLALKRKIIESSHGDVDQDLAQVLIDHGIALELDSLSAVEELVQSIIEVSKHTKAVRSGLSPNLQPENEPNDDRTNNRGNIAEQPRVFRIHLDRQQGVLVNGRGPVQVFVRRNEQQRQARNDQAPPPLGHGPHLQAIDPDAVEQQPREEQPGFLRRVVANLLGNAQEPAEEND